MMVVANLKVLDMMLALIGTSDNLMMNQMGKIVETWLIHQPLPTPSYRFPKPSTLMHYIHDTYSLYLVVLSLSSPTLPSVSVSVFSS